MPSEFKWGDIIQVPRSALSPNLAKCYVDMFGVVISADHVWQHSNPPHYLVALIDKPCITSQTRNLEVEITTDCRFRNWVILPTLLVNILQSQISEIQEVDRKRDRLSNKDQRKLWQQLRSVLDLDKWRARQHRTKSTSHSTDEGGHAPEFPIWLAVAILLMVFLGAAAGAIAMHFFYPEVVSNLLGCPTPPTPGPY